ncbi:MAG: DUF975 family protein [Armatimonadota bacterium]
MNMESISFGRCFAEGMEAFKKYMGIAIAVVVVYAAISWAASAIPVVGTIWSFTGEFALMGGLYVFLLKVIRSQDPNFSDLFSQFGDFVRWLGVGWLVILYSLVAAIISAVPLGVLALLGLIAGKDSMVFQILVALGAIASSIVFVAIVVRWAFVYYAAADEGLTAKAALARSEELTAGIRPQVFVVSLVAGLLGAAGAIALGVGLLFTLPLSQCILTVLYINVKAMKSPNLGFSGATDSSEPIL